MCGIAGFLERGGTREADARAHLGRMTASLAHRGPDDVALWLDPAAGIALGHRRLCVIDPSPRGRQPMESPGRRYVLTYNGEIYNFRELRARLEWDGTRFEGHSDTEVLAAALEAWGPDRTVRRIEGMFAFAAWDRERRELTLARDRVGIKPLFYGMIGARLVFASELRAFRAHPAFDLGIDLGAVHLLVRHGYIPDPFSIHHGVRKLRPGSLLTVRADDLSGLPDPAPYWCVRDVVERGLADPIRGSADHILEALQSAIDDAVASHLQADVPLGVLLSGGIDSATVAASVRAATAETVQAFTIGFDEDRFDETAEAAAVARHLGLEHHVLQVQARDALEVIPGLSRIYDEPFADPSQIPTALVSAFARRRVTVGLTGDGGDELFAGYRQYARLHHLWSLRGLPLWARRAGARVLAGTLAGGGHAAWSDRAAKAASVLPFRDSRDLYFRVQSKVPDPARFLIGGEEPVTGMSQRRSRIGDPVLDACLTDMTSYLPGDILAKVDRASMAVSLEARVPLLDHRVIELAFRVPMALKIRSGRGKWPLRELLARRVPRPLVDGPKRGFAVPLAAWLRGPLRPWAEDLLAEDRLRAQGLLRPHAVRRLWDQHLARTHDWKFGLWNILMLQSWLEEGAHAPAAAGHASPSQGG